MFFFIKKKNKNTAEHVTFLYIVTVHPAREISHREIIQPTDVYIQPGLPWLAQQWWKICAGLGCMLSSSFSFSSCDPPRWTRPFWPLCLVPVTSAPKRSPWGLFLSNQSNAATAPCVWKWYVTGFISHGVGRLQKRGNVAVVCKVGFFWTANKHCSAHRLPGKHLCRQPAVSTNLQGRWPQGSRILFMILDWKVAMSFLPWGATLGVQMLCAHLFSEIHVCSAWPMILSVSHLPLKEQQQEED